MKIIISPAKRMREDLDFLPPRGLPRFLDRAEHLRDYLRGLSYADLKKLLACNDQIAELNHARYQSMDLRKRLTPALLAYEGIQYRYMAPALFTPEQFEYAETHLRILSGLYGLLKPFDGVTPYRLEMQAKLRASFCTSLYDFWGDCLCHALTEEEDLILDLASEEYSKAIRPHLNHSIRYVTIVFSEWAGRKLVTKGVHAKMARGEMVNYLSERGAENLEVVKGFQRLDYRYHAELSQDDRLYFLREAQKS